MLTVGSMVDYLTLYGQYVKTLKLTQGGRQAIGLCPFHDDKRPSFSVNLGTGLYLCHSCGTKGNAYQFAEAKNHPNPGEWIDDTDKQTYSPKYGPKAPTTDLLIKAKEYQKNLSEDWIKESKIAMGMYVGRDPQGRLTFPYFDEDGNIIGIKHHKGTNGEQPYWEGDGKCKWYGLHLLKGFDRNKNLYICEGERDCLRMLSIGHQATTGSAGAGSIPKDMKPISNFIEYITIYDNDSAGNDGAKKLARKMEIEV